MRILVTKLFRPVANLVVRIIGIVTRSDLILIVLLFYFLEFLGTAMLTLQIGFKDLLSQKMAVFLESWASYGRG